MSGVGHVHVDAPRLIVLSPNDPDHLGRLNEYERVRSTITHEEGNARRHTARLWRKGALLSGQHLVDILLHALLHPRLQVRIGKIRNPKGRLLVDAVGSERM